jgi:predicted RNA binding protein YcfA (HicA-like mRNA interferase family)
VGERLPRVKGKEIVSGLARFGFMPHHVRGSHHTLRNAAGRQVTVPVHAGHIIGPGLLRRILEQAGVVEADFRRVL